MLNALSLHPSKQRSRIARAGSAAIASCFLAAGCGSTDDAASDPPCLGCSVDAATDNADMGTYDATTDSTSRDGDATSADSTHVEADASMASDADGAGVDCDEGGADTATTDTSSEAQDTGMADVLAADGDANTADSPETDAATDASPQDGEPPADSGYLDVVAEEAAAPEASTGVLTGGPCISGAVGKTAYRIKWIDAGGKAQVVYEVNGLPDHSKDHAGAYGYSIGFTPQFDDPYLGEGGLLLDSSDFVDIELSTIGVSSIASITLSIYGRSFNTTASGSFDWQTFEDIGSTAYGLVSNVAPYAWYSTDMTTGISPGNGGVLLRIKSGPPSDALIVNRIEICMDAK